ncbi:MAG: hypothetical protein EBV06_00555 [Planctomycetia bacterium]|nr:hypothetical protein [Planctomycetia bacterium]
MKRFALSTICLLAIFSIARAHEPEPGSLVSMVLDTKVQKEILLTDAQRADVENLRAADQKDPAAAQSTLLGTLKPSQVKRLREITYQARGGAAIADEAVAIELKLTPEQKAQVATIWRNKVLDLQMREKVARFRNPAARSAWLLRNRREQGDDLLAVLTEDQKKTFETMKGRPFDFGTKK